MASMIAEGPSTQRFATDEERWQAVIDRNRAADEAFFRSVRTTGVYCRPSCGARLPRRENVAFHATPAEAEAAGFRACLRCKPNLDRSEARRRRRSRAPAAPSRRRRSRRHWSRLPKSVGQSPYHFHRVFKAATGLTPKAYADAHRGKRVRDGLKRAGTVTEAIYSAGFNSNGRFYAASDELLGMKPTDFREGGAGATIRFAVGECSLGAILVAATDKGVCAIMLDDDPQELVRAFQDDFPKAQLVGGDEDFERVVAAAIGLVEAPKRIQAAARRARHGVPAARLAGTARYPRRQDRDL